VTDFNTLAEFLALSIGKLKAANIDNPALDARLLICHALGLDRAQLLSQSARVLNTQETALIEGFINRRAGHESVARIIGKREFWGLDFTLNEATLEPRPDSETLVEAVLHRAAHHAGLRILDLGTGTGCLLLALLHDLPTASGLGIDIAPRAVEQAQANAAALGLNERAVFQIGNWFSGIAPQDLPPPRGEGLREGGVPQEKYSTNTTTRPPPPTPRSVSAKGLRRTRVPRPGVASCEVGPRGAGEDYVTLDFAKFDIIISNPPYIPAADIGGLMQDVREFDPTLALDGGADGLDPYRLLIPQLKHYLNPNGLVAFEVGQGQASEVADLLQQSGFTNIATHKDLGGIERVVTAARPQ
jgi:release factor glutamine methyltransferase